MWNNFPIIRNHTHHVVYSKQFPFLRLSQNSITAWVRLLIVFSEPFLSSKSNLISNMKCSSRLKTAKGPGFLFCLMLQCKVRMAEWSKAPDSRDTLLPADAVLSILVSERVRGFESHFWQILFSTFCLHSSRVNRESGNEVGWSSTSWSSLFCHNDYRLITFILTNSWTPLVRKDAGELFL